MNRIRKLLQNKYDKGAWYGYGNVDLHFDSTIGLVYVVFQEDFSKLDSNKRVSMELEVVVPDSTWEGNEVFMAHLQSLNIIKKIDEQNKTKKSVEFTDTGILYEKSDSS